MYHKDYLMRLIEQLTAVVGRLMGLKKQQKHEQAISMIDEWLEKEFRLTSDLINVLSAKDIITILKTTDLDEKEKVIAVAAMIKEEGELYEALNEQGESRRRYLKSLQLFLAAEPDESVVGPIDCDKEIIVLLAKLAEYELPAETNKLLWPYYEKMGRYADAENILFELLEMAAIDHQLAEEGVLFYKRLLEKEDQELLAGNLPREEVRQGLEDWQKKAQAD